MSWIQKVLTDIIVALLVPAFVSTAFIPLIATRSQSFVWVMPVSYILCTLIASQFIILAAIQKAKWIGRVVHRNVLIASMGTLVWSVWCVITIEPHIAIAINLFLGTLGLRLIQHFYQNIDLQRSRFQ